MKKSNDRMNPDDFEQQLARQPLRPVPPAWRNEILQVASMATATGNAAAQRSTFFSTVNSQLSSLLWPCPQAWAGLAAVWVAILVLNHFDANRPTAVASRPLPSPDAVIVLREQRRELAKLVEPWEKIQSEPMEPPKVFVPRPRGAVNLDVKIV